MKKLAGILMLFAVLGLTNVAWANHMEGREQGTCSMDKGGPMMCGKCGQPMESSPCPITDKLMKKAHFLLDNQAEIGLSDDQAREIKDIKMQAKKNTVRQGADMEIMMIDMQAKLSEEKVDVDGLNAMIDQGMAQMTQSAKEAVAAYAKLKGILTPDQMAKAKEIWKKQ